MFLILFEWILTLHVAEIENLQSKRTEKLHLTNPKKDQWLLIIDNTATHSIKTELINFTLSCTN